MPILRFVRSTMFAVLLPVVAIGFAQAQTNYPERPVRLVVPFAAGGGTDLVMRVVAEAVAAEWKQSIIIENKPGGGTTIGAQAVAASPADGYTLFANTASFLISPHLMDKRPYDALKDFVPVALVAASPHVLVVSANVPAKTLGEFVAWAKAKPGGATFASFGAGSSSHLGFEILRNKLGLDMLHVPYKGAAPALTDLMGGQVDAMLADLSTVAENAKTDRLRALAVAGETRTPALPDLPTVSEAGVPGFESKSWFGLVARAGTPPEVIAKWNAAVNAALKTQAVKDRLASFGIGALGSTAQAFGDYLKTEETKYVDALKLSGVGVKQ